MRCAHWKRGAAAAAPFDQVPSGENVPITVNRRDTVSREEASERGSGAAAVVVSVAFLDGSGGGG